MRSGLPSVTAPTRCDLHPMLRWLIIVSLTLLVVQGVRPWLAKIGLGRLPLDLHFRAFGREWWLPIGSTVLLSFVAMLIGHLI